MSIEKPTPTTSTVDLMVLGLLLEKPRNAYELVRLVEERQLTRLLQISKPAVYKSCKRLFGTGLLDGQTVREGELPEKVIYKVNRRGKHHFAKLMDHYSKEIQPIYFSFNSFLWQLDKLPASDALSKLEQLQASLRATKEWIDAHEKEARASASLSFPARVIIKQYRMLITTLVEWIAETKKEFEKRR